MEAQRRVVLAAGRRVQRVGVDAQRLAGGGLRGQRLQQGLLQSLPLAVARGQAASAPECTRALRRTGGFKWELP